MLVGCSADSAVVRAGSWCARVFRMVIVGGAILATSASAMGAEPSAADKETARNLMNQGDASFVSKDFEAALRSYVAADQIMGVPTTGVEVAKAQEALGKLVEARDTLLQVMRYPKTDNEPSPFVKAREQANERARQLAERIPSVTVLLSGLGEGQRATVKIDGTVLHAAAVGVPRKLNPGKHTIEVTATGFVDVRRDIDLPERAQERVTIELQSATAAPPLASTQPAGRATETPKSASAPVEADRGATTSTSSLTYIGFGLAGVGLTVGGITGALAYSKTGTAKDQCTDNVCPTSAESDIDSAKSMGTISTVSFAVGLVGAAVGVYGLMNPSEPEASATAARPAVRWQPTVGLGNVGVSGQF